MKYLTYIALFITFLFPSLCFADMPPDLQKIISNKKITIALNSQEYPPYVYQNANHELDGFDIALAKEIAKILGVKLEFNRNAKSFNDVIKEVEQGHADLGMGAISATPERGISVSFSQPYLLIKKVLIVNRLLDLKLDSKQIDTLKFGVPKDSSYENALHEKFFSLNRYPNSSQLISYDNMDLAFKDVLAGKIYAFYTDEAYANSFFEKNKKAHLYVKKDILQRQFDPITIAVSWKNQTLLNWINLYIQSIRIDGTEDMLMKKYLKGL
jgi:ABC-type amino acid transport substrate-binding protein